MTEAYDQNPDQPEDKTSRITTPLEANDVAESNGHQPPETTSDDAFSYEEQLEFAGVDPDEGELVTTEDLLDKPSTAKARGAENSPLARTGLVVAGLGSVVFLIWILSGFFGGSEQVAEEPEAPLPEETASTFDESDRYRAELALIEQDEAEAPRRRAENIEPESEAEPEPEVEPEQPEPQVIRATSSSPPSPPPREAPMPPPSPQPAASTPQPLPQPASEPEEAIDPLEQWSRLASAGTAGGNVALKPEPEFEEDASASAPNAADPPTAAASNPAPLPTPNTANNPSPDVLPSTAQSFPFPTATIGDNPVPLPGDDRAKSQVQTVSQSVFTPTPPAGSGPMTDIRSSNSRQLVASSPGAQGILNQQPIATPNTATSEEADTNRIRQVAIGASTNGKVIVPIIYAGGEASSQGRFAIELTEPLVDINGNVALEAGTVLITQLTEILDAQILRQEVVAIVYTDADGQVRQEAIEPNVLIIRGQDNTPLIADVRNDGGGTFGDDLLVGALSALGNVGSIINAPDAVTTATSGTSGNTSSSSTSTTVTSGDDDNIIAAVLEGFFTPVSERVSERAADDNSDSEPYLVIPEGRDVSIFVNGLLEVVR